MKTQMGTQLDWKSATLFVVADPQWRQKIIRGGWIVLIPLIGWPIILGYRSKAVFRLVGNQRPLLPDWNEGLTSFLIQGLKAVAVINVYYLPSWGLLAMHLWGHPSTAEIPWGTLLAFFAVLPIFSTLIIPVLVFWGQFLVTTPIFSWTDSLMIALVTGFLTFLIPAGFLNVSQTGRMMSAFNFADSLRTIGANFARYVEAWIGSGIIAVLAHAAIPFSPWGVFWCYLSIIFSFNEVPLNSTGHEPANVLWRSVFAGFRSHFRDDFEIVSRSLFIERWERRIPPKEQDGVAQFIALRVGPLRVPIG